jgi:hypothetical protein
MASIGAPRAERIKRSLAQSTSITAIWTWFLILAAKAAEPVLVASVFVCLSQVPASRPLSPQYDIVVFLAQFVALDIGGPTSLNKLADQAKHEGNDEGASQVKRLSVELVVVMLDGTSQVAFFGGRFIRAANSQSAHYDTVVNTSPPTTRT